MLLNKIDLGRQIRPENLPGIDSMAVSLQKSPPTDEISAKILQKVVQKPSGSDQEPVAISERHRNALLIALDEVIYAEKRLKTASEADFLPAATHARAALDQIGFIFGKNITEDMLDRLFSRFCVGK